MKLVRFHPHVKAVVLLDQGWAKFFVEGPNSHWKGGGVMMGQKEVILCQSVNKYFQVLSKSIIKDK